MIHEYPDYYEYFECIGGKCPDSCCIGWELDIDDESYDYYKNVEGEFGDRLRANMSKDGEKTFVLAKHDRCPFLNEENLCDIYINLGEESLCKVCTEYPRYSENIDDYIQSDISLSCMEVGRIIFSEHDKIRYMLDNGRKRRKLAPELAGVLDIRDKLIKFLNDCCDAGVNVLIAVNKLLDFAERCHTLYAAGKYNKIRKIKPEKAAAKVVKHSGIVLDFWSDWNDIYDILKELEVIDESWTKILEDANEQIRGFDNSRMEKFLNSVLKEQRNNYYKILIYFVFRYMIRAYDDGNILAKARFALFSFETILVLDYARWMNNSGHFSVDDRIDVAHIYSKEIEHSAENVDFILEEMLFFGFNV